MSLFYAINNQIIDVEVFHDSHFLFRLRPPSSSYQSSSSSPFIKIYLSNEHYCCEKFGIDLYSSGVQRTTEHSTTNEIASMLLALQGQILQGVSIDFDPPSKTDEKKNWYGERQSIDVTFQMESGEEIRFDIFNEHNGYYAHDYEIDVHVGPHASMQKYEGRL